MGIYYVASTSGATGSSLSLTVPTGTDTGHIVVYAVYNANTLSNQNAFTWPGGFTVVESRNLGSIGRFEVAWKAWASGETSYSVTIPTNQGGGTCWGGSSYGGADLTTPFDTDSSNAMTGSPWTTPSVSSSVSGVWRLSMFTITQANNGGTTWSSYSPADSERSDTNRTSGTYRATLATADSNGTVSVSGGTTVTATPASTLGWNVAGSWIGILKPAPVPDSVGVLMC